MLFAMPLLLSSRYEVAMSLLTEPLCDPTQQDVLCEVAQSNYSLLDCR